MTLSGAIEIGFQGNEERVLRWLQTQGVEPCYFRYEAENRTVLSLLETIEHAINSHGIDILRVHLAGNYSRFDEPDIGVARSSSGWECLPNFITSSALIRILGAMEQFEIDVLKALLYYRPQGKNTQDNLQPEDADVSVAIEEPDSEGRYTKPALWSWIKKSSENTVERRKLYKSVFGIECYPSTFGNMKAADIRKYYQSLYDKRNALAHGRNFVEVQLADYCEAEAFALALIMHLSAECNERYKLGV